MRRILIVFFALAYAASSACAQSPTTRTAAPSSAPTLVVLITIDGFREDYLTRFGPQLRGGLARLTKGGAWFTNAHHDHAITETAPGHATLLAGRFPRSTGIAANRAGVLDDAAALLGTSGVAGASPTRFQGTTLVDWLHAANPRSRALSVSMKDRAAILPIGKSKQEVYWYPGDGEFTTSRYYADSLPDWVKRFNARHLAQAYAGKAWTTLLPDSAYHERDSVSIESGGVDFVFPHPMPPDSAAAASYVRGTPFIDDLIVALALDGVGALRLGEGPQTDVLALSLSGTDLVGHRFGPDSKEVHDDVLRVDRTIGVFLDSLFRLRDPSRVIVALTADHGFGTIPELAPASLNPHPDRVSLAPVLTAVRERMRALGVDTTAMDVDQQVVFINRGLVAKTKVNPDSLVALFVKLAKQEPGIYRIDRFRDLLKGDTVGDPITRRWVHQFPANFPLELVATQTRGSLWLGSPIGSHGSPYDYDTNVPIIFYGPGFNAGKYAGFVRTVDIAPTLAQRVGVKPGEKLDGVVLTRALK